MQRGPATAGGRASPTAELRALPRRPRGPTRPRPAGLSLRHASPSRSLLAAETPTETWKPRASLGTGSGRSGAPWPPRAAPTSPAPASVPWATGLAGVKLAAGGAALPLRLKPLEAGSPRAGPGGTYRARRRRAQSTRRFLRSCLRAAGVAGRAAPGGSGRRPAGLAAAPRGSTGLRGAPSAAPGRRAVRGSGERAAPTSGVSPLQIGSEGGGSGGRDANKKERAGAPAAPFARAGGGASAAQGPGPFSPPAREPRAGFPRRPTARRSCWACPGRHPKGRAESPVPPLVLKCPPPGFSALRLLSA